MDCWGRKSARRVCRNPESSCYRAGEGPEFCWRKLLNLHVGRVFFVLRTRGTAIFLRHTKMGMSAHLEIAVVVGSLVFVLD